MGHSITQLWVHSVFGTKDLQPLITEDRSSHIFKIVSNELTKSGCTLRIINGMPDHIHILFGLSPNKTISEVMKQIKGASTYEINNRGITEQKFAWQTGYGAFSVGASNLTQVESYIRNQQTHHQKKTFMQEYEEFMRMAGVAQG